MSFSEVTHLGMTAYSYFRTFVLSTVLLKRIKPPAKKAQQVTS